MCAVKPVSSPPLRSTVGSGSRSAEALPECGFPGCTAHSQVRQCCHTRVQAPPKLTANSAALPAARSPKRLHLLCSVQQINSYCVRNSDQVQAKRLEYILSQFTLSPFYRTAQKTCITEPGRSHSLEQTLCWGLAGALANCCFVSKGPAPLPGRFLHPPASRQCMCRRVKTSSPTPLRHRRLQNAAHPPGAGTSQSFFPSRVCMHLHVQKCVGTASG